MRTVTLIPGDGIGPEVTNAAKRILEASGAKLAWEPHDAGAAVAEKRGTTLPPEVLESIRRNKVALKGPIGTPIGKGFRSVNVTLRQTLDLYANVRPVRSLPGIEPRFEGTDIVIVRENTEDLYAGLELMIMPGIAQSIKLITERGCTRICEYAFKYAEQNARKRVTVVHKANIMKLSDGLLLDCFRKVAQRHPTIEPWEVIVDACAMQMVKSANKLDVIVTENLYGDILSDLGAGLVGGLGIVPGANIGEDAAVFEAVHGSAPDIAGQGIANPTAVVQSGIMMLRHIGEMDAAARVEKAIIDTYARGIKTGDLGIVPGANIGEDAAVFEAVHGSAPDIAGQGIANPTAVVQSGIMMLRHIGEMDAAARVEKAIIDTYARGIKTGDLGGTANTETFTRAVCDAIAKG